jgi:DNA-binding MarR family transcriptional regulator
VYGKALALTIDNLETDGLVVRKNDPEDMRKQLISLTSKGEIYHTELMIQ